MCKAECQERPSIRGHRLRIVIAGNNPALRRFYREAYRRLGHEVVGEAGGERQAAELYRALRPDLLLTVAEPAGTEGVVRVAGR
jgi:hypothetical protein